MRPGQHKHTVFKEVLETNKPRLLNYIKLQHLQNILQKFNTIQKISNFIYYNVSDENKTPVGIHGGSNSVEEATAL